MTTGNKSWSSKEFRNIDVDYFQLCIDDFQNSQHFSIFGSYSPSKEQYVTCPAVILFHPMKDKLNLFSCINPMCTKKSELEFKNQWTTRKSGTYSPRILLGYNRGAVLVSAKYSCISCQSVFLAHDDRLLDNVSNLSSLPFQLFFRTGYTQEAINVILDSVACGLSFQKVEDLFHRSVLRTWEQHCSHLVKFDNSLPAFQSPKKNSIKDIFLAHFRKMKDIYTSQLERVTGRSISLDHTFKICKHIRTPKKKGKKIQQFEAVIFFLNDIGQVMNFLFVRSKSLKDPKVQEALNHINNRGQPIDLVMTGNDLLFKVLIKLVCFKVQNHQKIIRKVCLFLCLSVCPPPWGRRP